MERTRIFSSGLSDQSSKPWMDIAYPVNLWSLSSSSPTSYNVGEAVLSGSGTSSWWHCFACKWILLSLQSPFGKMTTLDGTRFAFPFLGWMLLSSNLCHSGLEIPFLPLCGFYTLPGANASGPLVCAEDSDDGWCLTHQPWFLGSWTVGRKLQKGATAWQSG